MFSFTILIVTYNSDWEKLVLTLDSCLAQKFSDYEIVIADDGSRENHKEQLIEYFRFHSFNRYTLVMNETNHGTVKNLISGLNASKGKYIRDFGAGDMFYSENTLEHLYQFFESTKCEACFGLLRGYMREPSGRYSFHNFPHPFDIDAYKKKDIEKIKRNLVLYRDNASGAATSYTKEFYLHYLKQIEDCVLYLEDILQVLSGVENRPMAFFDEYVVYYEMKASVVEKNNNFKKLLTNDIVSFYEMLYKLYPNDKYVKKQHGILKLYDIYNVYARTILRLFKNPGLVLYLFSHFTQSKRNSYSPSKDEPGFFNESTISNTIPSILSANPNNP